MNPLLKLSEFRKHRVYKYFASFIIISLATLAQLSLWEFIGPANYLIYYPAVILACLYGDGNFGILLATLSSQYFFINKGESLAFSWPNDYVRSLVFLVPGMMIRYLINQLIKAKLKSDITVQLLNEEKASREIFVNTLTHDLQTPLTSAKLNLQILNRGMDESTSDRKLIAKVLKSVQRVEVMIRDLLDVSSIKAGKTIHLNFTQCDLRSLLEQVITDLNLIHGHRFELTSEQVTGYWNPEGIRRIIENLCTNAVKYGDKDSIIGVSARSKSESEVSISVNNRGAIITRIDLETLFEPFKRTKSASESTNRGWGLGLSLVKGLSEAHGGKVRAESNATDGTTFTIQIPRDSRTFNT